MCVLDSSEPNEDGCDIEERGQSRAPPPRYTTTHRTFSHHFRQVPKLVREYFRMEEIVVLLGIVINPNSRTILVFLSSPNGKNHRTDLAFGVHSLLRREWISRTLLVPHVSVPIISIHPRCQTSAKYVFWRQPIQRGPRKRDGVWLIMP
jgi:hypothetical protein